MKRPGPSYTHILAFALTAVAYFAWAYLGYYLTGEWAYWFLDYSREGGWEGVGVALLALLAFMSLLNICSCYLLTSKDSQTRYHAAGAH